MWNWAKTQDVHFECEENMKAANLQIEKPENAFPDRVAGTIRSRWIRTKCSVYFFQLSDPQIP